ncbi:MAG: hypothetical protein WB677_21155 [Xanthobacteraceae bacterium]
MEQLLIFRGCCAKNEPIGERPVNKNDEYRANAAECERMARSTRNESEKRMWREMAESWLRMIKPSPQSAAADRFDAMELERGTRLAESRHLTLTISS